MNINGIRSGLEEVRTAGAMRSLEVDLTVSDRGVERRPSVQVAKAPAQVTSSPTLQAVLTAEETFSLAQQFGSNESNSASQPEEARNTYDLSGKRAGQVDFATHGRLIDFRG